MRIAEWRVQQFEVVGGWYVWQTPGGTVHSEVPPAKKELPTVLFVFVSYRMWAKRILVEALRVLKEK